MNILHLYPDSMSLYGESGNVKAIAEMTKKSGETVEIYRADLDSEPSFGAVDFVYMGQGTEENELRALAHLKKYKEPLISYLEGGGRLLATGNAWEIFGKSITYRDKEYEGLKVFDYTTLVGKERLVDECEAHVAAYDVDIVGFSNHSGTVTGSNNGFTVFTKGRGQSHMYKGFMGTHMIGPILARNEELTKKLLKEVLFAGREV